MIIDYSTLRPSTAQLKAAGVTAVGRYAGWDSVPGFSSIGKNLTHTEARALIGAGISIFLAFEYAADAPSKGAAQGALDGALAVSQLAEVGAPAGMGVYYACDWDVPDYAPQLPDTPGNAVAKLGPVAKYFQAIHALKPSHQVGGYGGYYVIKRLFDAGLITLGWQTVAWSGIQIDRRAQIYQTGQMTLGAADVDVHETAAADFGQWPRPGSAPSPVPAPSPVTWQETMMNALPMLKQGATGADVRTVQGLLIGRGYSATVDGVFGPATDAVVRRFQGDRHLGTDGIVGAATWPALMNVA